MINVSCSNVNCQWNKNNDCLCTYLELKPLEDYDTDSLECISYKYKIGVNNE